MSMSTSGFRNVAKAYCQVALTIQHLGGESEATKQILTLVPDSSWKPRFIQQTRAEMRDEGDNLRYLHFHHFFQQQICPETRHEKLNRKMVS